MKNDLISSLLDFMRREKIKMGMQKTSDSEFWFESPNGFIVVKFVVDKNTNEILYDVFSPKHDVHLKEETIRDVERLDFIAEEKGEWDYEKSIEDLWLILDSVKLWAKKNKFSIKEKHLI